MNKWLRLHEGRFCGWIVILLYSLRCLRERRVLIYAASSNTLQLVSIINRAAEPDVRTCVCFSPSYTFPLMCWLLEEIWNETRPFEVDDRLLCGSHWKASHLKKWISEELKLMFKLPAYVLARLLVNTSTCRLNGIFILTFWTLLSDGCSNSAMWTTPYSYWWFLHESSPGRAAPFAPYLPQSIRRKLPVAVHYNLSETFICSILSQKLWIRNQSHSHYPLAVVYIVKT